MKKVITILALVTASAAHASGPSKCYYGTAELGYVCGPTVPSWNQNHQSFDAIDKYFRDHNLKPTLTEGGCTETSHRALPVKCAIDLDAAQN